MREIFVAIQALIKRLKVKFQSLKFVKPKKSLYETGVFF
jgi:hypothetical protein